MSDKKLKFETLQIHGRTNVRPHRRPRRAYYQTTSYVFDNGTGSRAICSDWCRKIFTHGLPIPPLRWSTKLAVLEGGTANYSGIRFGHYLRHSQYCEAGDNLVSASTAWRVRTTCSALPCQNWELPPHLLIPTMLVTSKRPSDDKTKALLHRNHRKSPALIWTWTQWPLPKSRIVIANIPLIVDNTFGTPYLIRPIEYGADVGPFCHQISGRTRNNAGRRDCRKWQIRLEIR